MFLRLFKYLWPERYLPEPEQDDPFNEDPPPRAGKVGVLLVNLGTPDAPHGQDIRKYLGEFLSDPRVIEIPRYLWKPILHGLVLTLRPKLAPRYAGIWLQDGSPLMVYSRRQAEGVAARCARRAWTRRWNWACAMATRRSRTRSAGCARRAASASRPCRSIRSTPPAPPPRWWTP